MAFAGVAAAKPKLATLALTAKPSVEFKAAFRRLLNDNRFIFFSLIADLPLISCNYHMRGVALWQVAKPRI
jgi:hypothetical protein